LFVSLSVCLFAEDRNGKQQHFERICTAALRGAALRFLYFRRHLAAKSAGHSLYSNLLRRRVRFSKDEDVKKTVLQSANNFKQNSGQWFCLGKTQLEENKIFQLFLSTLLG